MRRLFSRMVGSVDPTGGPCRNLAVRVIALAFRDLASSEAPHSDHESARVFLAGSSMLDHWCAVADLDPARMIARANRLTTESGGQRVSGRAGSRKD